LRGRIRAQTVKLGEIPSFVHLAGTEQGSISWLGEATKLVAFGPYLALDPGTGPGRFEQAAGEAATILGEAETGDEVDVPGTGPIILGSFTFDDRTPGSRLLVPSRVYGWAEGVAWETTVTFDGPSGATFACDRTPRSNGDAESGRWLDSVRQALKAIAAGKLTKVVLAREVRIEVPGPLRQVEVVERLSNAFPGCFTFAFENLVGASPELLVRRLGDVVDSIPLAGSARRGIDYRQDRLIGEQLIASPKDRAEHALTVDSVMQSLGPYCSELAAEAEPSLLLLKNLQHLSTKVQGRLKGHPNALQLAGALHPTAAVGGTPAEPAMEMIRSLEASDRGRYAGPIGWMDHKGDGEWAVALRCAEVEGRVARVFAGAGIVAGSDPENELAETDLKLQAMLGALISTTPAAQ
jgi:menaquinone-specific isochorismate synthase